MDRRLNSRDIGLDCNFIACARTDGDVIQKFANHIQAFHAMEGFSEEFYDRILSSVHDGICGMESSPDESLCQACSGTCTC